MTSFQPATNNYCPVRAKAPSKPLSESWGRNVSVACFGKGL